MRHIKEAARLSGRLDTYEISSRLPKSVPLTLVLRARTMRLPKVTSGGPEISASFDPAAVGAPALAVPLPAAPSKIDDAGLRGAASILFLPLDARKNLASLKVEASLYGIVVALLAVTLVRAT
jgi:hypothetical protein